VNTGNSRQSVRYDSTVPRLPGTHIDDPRRLGQRLREARERVGLSQRQLAFEGCTNAYISRLEAGHRIPSLQLIHEFARRLQVSPQWLATGVEEVDAGAALLDAEVALRLGEVDEARELYRQRLNENPNDVVGLVGLGEIAFRESKLQRATALLERAVELLGDRLLEQPSAVETLVRAYVRHGQLDAAIALLGRALEQAEQAKTLVETLRFRILLANALIDAGDRTGAERLLAQAIRVAEGLRDPIATARVLWSQSRLHVVHKDPTLAVRYARRAIDILERTENDAYVAMAYQTLAFAELEAGQPESALAQLRRGRELLGRDLSSHADAKFSLEETRALLALDRVKEAAASAAETVEKLELLDPGDRGRGYLILGEVFQAGGDRERAKSLLELAVDTLEREAPPHLYIGAAARRLADLLEEEGRPDEALAVLKRAVGRDRAAPRTPAPVE
jgi:tetratricopeptide (TPR) repeat protein